MEPAVNFASTCQSGMHRLDEVSRGLLPAWNMPATAGISTNLFSLLDFATAQELYRQVHILSFEFANDSGFAELVKELTEHCRFRECRDFFTDKRSHIQDGKLAIEMCSQDIDFLLKVFAAMLPDMAATVIEQLFCLHQNLSLALEYMTQHMADTKTKNNGAKSLEWQNKKESIWQLHIKEAVASACSDLENHRETLFLVPMAQEVDILAKISNRMKGAADRISTNIRNSTPCFMQALDLRPCLTSFHEPMQYSAVLGYLRYKTGNGVIRVLGVQELAEVCRFEFQRTKSALGCHAAVDLGPMLTEPSDAADHSSLIGQRARVAELELDAMDDPLLAVRAHFCRRNTEPQRAGKVFPIRHALWQVHPQTSRGDHGRE
ncbi:hypothetical protein LEL_01726 [Akanthomyces lecanii RCEF 1005]|uniref:Uncharacterized protein n=1 Tax=Akanthomyces lecanii RCEF 1005 TaxID=1081108 RepID=A0A169YHR9_CORDF|nr:hypothetical protein LEL_01726 [Akanthomyces lecanii RCEF 1005]